MLRKFNTLKTIFFKGSAGQDLERIIESLYQQQLNMNDVQTATEQHIEKLYQQAALAVQKIGVVRFNPFNDGGGNFSFSVALLNDHNTGVIITSMYGRQQNRIYTKRLEKGASESPLTEEEQQAVAQAIRHV